MYDSNGDGKISKSEFVGNIVKNFDHFVQEAIVANQKED